MHPSIYSEKICSTESSYSFTREIRLLTKHDYSAVFDDAPIRASNQNLLILSRPNQLGYPRLGIIVAKKHVKKACMRNTVKRCCRESFRLKQHKIPAIDAIVLARKGVDSLSKQELHKSLNGLWSRIAKKASNLSPKKG